MSVYIYEPDSDVYDNLVLVNSADYDRTALLVGTPLAATWTPIAARTLTAQKRGDFPSLTSHVPVLSKRAFDLLQPLIQFEVEPLGLSTEVGDLVAINVLDVCDCLDMSRSEVKTQRSGAVMYIRHHVFDEQCLQGRHMFKVRQAPLSRVYLSEEFKRRVEDAGLEGLIFQEAK